MHKTVPVLIAVALCGCAPRTDDSFAARAAARGEGCDAIAAGSALDAYGHHVGPAGQVYDDVYRDCMAWRASHPPAPPPPQP